MKKSIHPMYDMLVVKMYIFFLSQTETNIKNLTKSKKTEITVFFIIDKMFHLVKQFGKVKVQLLLVK